MDDFVMLHIVEILLMAWPMANMKSSLFSLPRVEAEGSFLKGPSGERLP